MEGIVCDSGIWVREDRRIRWFIGLVLMKVSRIVDAEVYSLAVLIAQQHPHLISRNIHNQLQRASLSVELIHFFDNHGSKSKHLVICKAHSLCWPP